MADCGSSSIGHHWVAAVWTLLLGLWWWNFGCQNFLSENLMHDSAMDIGESEISARKSISQFFMIHSQEM